MHPSRAITLLHISDTQFGRNHRFGRLGLPEPDALFDTLFARLCDDLRLLKEQHRLVPDLVIASGDLAEQGKRTEFNDVLALLTGLTDVLGLPRERVVIVPGNHDINRKYCEAYFATCEADEQPPVAPYWPKWEHFHRMFRAFYGDAASIQFTPDAPWSWYEHDDLKLVVAGLNSTMAESHLDHHGYLGEKQLRWFAEKLRVYKNQGWFRLGVMHHNQQRGVPSDDESLHDAGDLGRHLAGFLNLLLHGHTHEGKVHWLDRIVPILSTGSAAVTAPARPGEVPNQYQVLRLHPDRIERYTRCYDPGQKRWIGDNRGSEDGDQWITNIPVEFQAVAGLFPGTGTRAPEAGREGLHAPRHPGRDPGQFEPRRDDLLRGVEEVCRLRQPNAQVIRVQARGLDYLRVTETDGAHFPQYPVGVADGGLTPDYLARFVAEVHWPYRGADSGVISQIVYAGDRPSQTLLDEARRQGVRVMSVIEYQGLIDFRPYLERQTRRLENDSIYLPAFYVPQRMGCEAGWDRFDSEDALATVTEWLAQPEPRFVLLLGEMGTGKSFLLHMLALQLAGRNELPTPVLIEMRGLQKARTLDELVAQHLSGAGVNPIDLQAFRYMLAQGRIALLFDGFDELALRVTYERAAEHFDTLIDAAAGRAKVVTTSRTQHFESEEQIKTALAARAERLPGRRIGRLAGFGETQIRRFLVNRYGGSKPAAEARLALIRDIRDLFGLATNPRMLGFIADLPDEQLREAREGKGEITSAVLYRMLVERWLANEHKRADPRGAGPALSLHDLWEAVTQLALRLWQQTEPSVRPGDLRDEAARLIPRLAVADMDAATAAHQLGSGTLLVRDEEGRFRFMHQSVMEWLVARRAAETLTTGEATVLLGRRELSPLMAEFVVALAAERGAALRDWVRAALDVATTAGEIVKKNALMINDRLGDSVPLGTNLAGQDLRGQDFSGRNLVGWDFQGADVRDTHFARADLEPRVGPRAPHARRPSDLGPKRRLQSRRQVPREREWGPHRTPLGPWIGSRTPHARRP